MIRHAMIDIYGFRMPCLRHGYLRHAAAEPVMSAP